MQPHRVIQQNLPGQRFRFRVMNKQSVLDLYFAEARSKLIDLAAFLDRTERAEGESDFRLASLRAGLRELAASEPGSHVERVLLLLSDPTTEPLAAATTKSAAGAWPGYGNRAAS